MTLDLALQCKEAGTWVLKDHGMPALKVVSISCTHNCYKASNGYLRNRHCCNVEKVPLCICIPEALSCERLAILTEGMLAVIFRKLEAFVQRLPACIFHFNENSGNWLVDLLASEQQNGSKWDGRTTNRTAVYTWPAAVVRPVLKDCCCCGTCEHCLSKKFGAT